MPRLKLRTEPVTRINAEVPRSLHERVKLAAVKHGSMTRIMVDALDTWLQTHCPAAKVSNAGA